MTDHYKRLPEFPARAWTQGANGLWSSHEPTADPATAYLVARGPYLEANGQIVVIDANGVVSHGPEGECRVNATDGRDARGEA